MLVFNELSEFKIAANCTFIQGQFLFGKIFASPDLGSIESFITCGARQNLLPELLNLICLTFLIRTYNIYIHKLE